MRMWLVLLAAAAAALPAMAQHRPSLNEREAAVRAISNWNSDCDGGARSSWDDMANAWYVGLILPFDWAAGSDAWYADGAYSNGNIVDSDFTDASIVDWGRDGANDRPDDVDAMCVAFHGGLNGDNNEYWVGSMRVNESGDGNCSTWLGHMDFGDEDIEFLVTSSCFSMSDSTWWTGWSAAFAGVHQVDGFHGIMYIRSSLIDNYQDFATDSFHMPMAYAFLDNLIDFRLNDEGQPKDQCPVARANGLSANGLWTRMQNERYDWVYGDPIGPSIHQGVMYIGGCDPSGDNPLPTE